MTDKKIFKNFLKYPPQGPIRETLATILGTFCLLGVGIFFLIRRENGFFTQKMPAVGSLIFSLIFGGTLLLFWLLLWRWTPRFGKNGDRNRRMLTTTLLLGFLISGLTLLPPGTSVLSQLVFALVFTTVSLLIFWAEMGIKRECKPEIIPETESENEVSEGEFTEDFEEEEEELETLLPTEVNQQLERSVSPEGEERISGLLRGNFGPNQSKIMIFTGFCPPFTRIPSVKCDVVEGDAEVEITHITPQGVSLSVRKRQRVPFEDSVILHLLAEE